MGRRKNTYTGILGCLAECEDCGWSLEAKNALANAARHADAHPDHTVHVEQILGVTYNRKTDDEALAAARQCGESAPHAAHARGAMVNGKLIQTECPGVPG